MKILTLLMGLAMAGMIPDFDSFWDYDKPEETRQKFLARKASVTASGDQESIAQLETQVARSYSLQGKFAEAHAVLDRIEKQVRSLPIAEVRYLLERGRTYNSAKETEKALPLFQEAYTKSIERKFDSYAVDAAHMMALAETTPAAKAAWNDKALQSAEKSSDPKARGWLSSLYNNMAWDFHDQGKFKEALALFEKALAEREKQGDLGTIRIAKWSVARAQRSLKQYDKALRNQRALEKELDAAHLKDGYVYEELGELYLLKRKEKESRKYFGLAYQELTAELKDSDPKRLERIRRLGIKE